MTDLDLLVDDDGKIWRTGSPALMRNLRIEERDYDLTRYLIRNLGFARFRSRRSDSRILIQPRFMTKATYESLVHVMVQNDPRRFAIEAIDTPRPIEIVPDLEDAVARLGDLATMGGNVQRKDFYREPFSLNRLRQDVRLKPISWVLNRWRALEGGAPDMERVLGDPILNGRALMFRMGGTKNGILEYVGDGFPTFSAASRISMLGSDSSKQPDPRYGLTAAAAYQETISNQAPKFELIDAIIRVPGQIARRYRYERLLLPWRRGGTTFVSVTSILRAKFDVVSDT